MCWKLALESRPMIISSYTVNWMSFIGVFFMLIVIFFPRGVLGILKRSITK